MNDNTAKKSNKIFIIRLALILFLIVFISTLLLTLCNYLTKDKIAALEQKTANEARQAVIPGAIFEEIKLSESEEKEFSDEYDFKGAYRAEKDGKFSGYCINVAPNGFGGEINMIVGLDENLNYTGIKIISLSETPGLGAKASESEFTKQFSDKKKGKLEVIKNAKKTEENQINAISGATITSKAVTTGVNNALKIAEQINNKEAEQN